MVTYLYLQIKEVNISSNNIGKIDVCNGIVERGGGGFWGLEVQGLGENCRGPSVRNDYK